MGHLTCLLVIACLVAVVQSTCFNESRGYLLYRYSSNNGDSEFVPRDDDAKLPLKIRGKYKYFGKTYTGWAWVVTNGVVALANATTMNFRYMPSEFAQNGTAFIASAYSDIDLQDDTDQDSHIWYRESRDQEDLDRFNNDIRGWFCKAGNKFSAKHLMIVTFERVESYCSHDADYYYYPSYHEDYAEYYYLLCNGLLDKKKRDVITPTLDGPTLNRVQRDYLDKDNTFQMVFATNNKGKSFVMFNYQSLCWFNCFCYTRAGFNNGFENTYEIVNSGTSDFGLNDQLSNVNKPGRFMYRVDGNVIKGPDCKKLY